MASGTRSAGTGHAIVAGLVCALVGFTSSFAVVLTGLRAVGASPTQAASGLFALCIAMGLGCLIFSVRLRMPITMAWSTPGAALLVSAAVPAGGFAASVGAFVVCGVLLTLTALIRPLERAVRSIPAPIASAMLAGVLLTLCVEPFRAAVATPGAIIPVIAVWLLFTAFRPRWAVPAALIAAAVMMFIDGTFSRLDANAARPVVEWVNPTISAGALVAIAVPLFVVTMTSQNIPGIAVLSSFGYHPQLREPLGYAGVASVAGSLLGGHAINLAAISAALAAGPEAHPDLDRRWIAGATAGACYLVIGPLSGPVAAAAAAAPAGLMEAIAGLALIGTFASSAAAALGEMRFRDSAAVTFLVAASGLTIGGIGAAFWGLVAGLLFFGVTRWRR